MKTHVFRLHPGDDLKMCLEDYVRRHEISASVILSCVGSLRKLRVRDASGVNIQELLQECDIVSATGTAGCSRLHVHISCSREDLSVIGGHLTEGCIIKTTAEIVLLELESVSFEKEYDPSTGYNELKIAAK